ncbi:MAG TPA: thioredoxin family protein [Holophagaceae bacterium]|nr:thioredoxin family protein [Holophagaceae bacterium]
MILPLLLAAALQGAPAPQAVPATQAASAAPAPTVDEHGLPCDTKDHLGLLLGPTTRDRILEHRASFRDNTAKAETPAELKARWMAVRKPMTLVVVFGSWCGDSQREVPDFLALAAEENPFIDVRYEGVGREKKMADADWPKGAAPQSLTHVPTFYLFTLEPGGVLKPAGSIVENPPVKGQKMAEAVVDMIEKAAK